jgi:hypothetical protein
MGHPQPVFRILNGAPVGEPENSQQGAERYSKSKSRFALKIHFSVSKFMLSRSARDNLFARDGLPKLIG